MINSSCHSIASWLFSFSFVLILFGCEVGDKRRFILFWARYRLRVL